ncbi:MAG: hypothetical protein RRC34_10285 [Lentisphaeria bacterium]|nr:hypothetical protein [Lentisphaeria bacterium]
MMVFIWGVLLVCAGAVFEAAIGLTGVSLPMVLVISFYVFTAHLQRGLFSVACFTAVFIDIHFLRPALPTLLLVPAVLGLARLWRETGEVTHPAVLFFPGFLIGLSHCAAMLVFTFLAYRSFASLHPMFFLADILLPALALPVLTPLFDSCARRAGLPRFCDARPRRKEFYASRKNT